ncbi:two-component regulator propeller domain-containing protein [Zobellia uliginosa]|uniref:two-component regulator propeller domain-containing protein n=1 Tax=Zobellia uliginosa TaxID=143224 RepID=UPI001C07A6CE|nr:two-component regulator propeller domain-containing protein [Zobellia uliginosa]MBU2946174.1 response regulator [Zobellia uliginosa]
MKLLIENRLILKTIWLLSVVLVPFVFCNAQDNINFKHITTSDGLSQSDINTIYQDKQGFMWFGTFDGLNKYDGYKFTIHNPSVNEPNRISSNLISAITGDDQGNLWVGSTGKGLNFYDASTGSFKTFVHNEENPSSIIGDHITALFKDSKNRLWIGERDGLDMVDLSASQQNIEFQHINSEQDIFVMGWEGSSIYTIYEDKNGQLLVGGATGLFILKKDPKGNNYFGNINKSLGLPDCIVRSIAEDNLGRLVVATNVGLFCQIKGKGRKLVNIYESNVNKLLVDHNNRLWVGSNDGLLYFENTSTEKPPKLAKRFTYDSRDASSISKNIIKSLYLDKTGIIWVGTNGGGLNTFDPGRKQFTHIRNTPSPSSLSYDKIRAMYEDSNGTLWIGTEGGGLNMLLKEDDDGNYDKFKRFNSISKTFAITETTLNNKKTLLIGAESTPGFYLLDIDDPESIKESNFIPQKLMNGVFSLMSDSNDNLWIGTYISGVHRWTKNKDGDGYDKMNFKSYPKQSNALASNIVRNILEDKDGNVWFATGDGLSKLDKIERYKKNPKFQTFKNDPNDPKSISHDYILSLYQSTSGVLWVGTFGGGLNKFIPGKDGAEDSFVSYSGSDGLPNNVIKGILEDSKSNLWLSTNMGLSKFNPKKETFKNYNENDGLQDNEFQELACVKRADGEMLFGGINGFNAFYPEEIRDNEEVPETVITDMLISNKSVQVGSEVNGKVVLNKSVDKTKNIELGYKQNNFSFEFAALHYAAPSKNQFAYMLKGFDNDWIQTNSTKRFATYTNLSPGKYVFKVKASNNDGLWDESPTEINIKITPPIWQTSAAYLFYGLLVMGVLWLFWRYTFIRTSEKHQLELDHLEKKKSEEMQRVKLEFFTNISHEFRTPLTLIKGPLEYLRKDGSKVSQTKVQEQYNIMYKNTNYLLKLVNQLLDFRKIDQGKMHLVVRNSNIVDFIKEVGQPFQFLAHKQNVDFNISATEDAIISWFDHDALEKVMNNLLSNAFKYTPDGGHITIEISVGKKASSDDIPKNVVIKVRDSGFGIAKNRVSTIFERFNTQDKKDTRNLQGAGIGLSFTKNLIELHQGSIIVKSKPNKGTDFIVTLPMEKESFMNIPEVSIKEVSESDFLVRSSETESFAIGINDEILDEDVSKSRPKLPILLIVDDNTDIRTLVKQALDSEYVIYEAENGKQALQMAKSLMPNIILTDILMPVMNGTEFCEKLKANKETSHIPVVMLTAKASEESEIENLKLGVEGYIRKPFEMELLQLTLANILKQRDELRKQFTRNITLQPTEIAVTSVDESFLQTAIEIVEKHMMNTDFNVEMLVKEMGYSRSNLYMKFKEITGLSSSEFIRNIRLKRAVQLFEQSDLSVKEIMYKTGFNTASYFSKCFKKQFGVIPSEYVAKLKVKKTTS